MKKIIYDQNDHLLFGSTNLVKILKGIETPSFVYSEEILTQNFLSFKNAAEKYFHSPLIAFALKSNSNIEILKILQKLGAGADIVSEGECAQAIKAKIKPEKIVFSGVGKSKEEIHFALSQGSSGPFSFNVESVEELAVINEVAKKLKRKASVLLRFNPEIKAKTHKYISTGGKFHKFGITSSDIKMIFKNSKNYKNIHFKGLSVHIGSQLMNLEASCKAIRKMVDLTNTLPIESPTFDVGGGLGVAYHPDDLKNEPTVDEYMKMVATELNRSKKPIAKVVFEPGRRIVASAGILLMKVIRTKTSKGHHFLIVDAGMNDFVRPSLYEAYHHIAPLILDEKRKKINYDIVGPICETSDFFAHQRKLQHMQDEEILTLQDAGAYGFSMGSNYNLRVRPSEYLITKKNKLICARKKQKLSDVI